MLLDGKRTIQKTHYNILSVKEDANYEEIRAGYRSAILNSHPDKLQRITETSDPHRESQEQFLTVQKAWEILSDTKSRSTYDRELRDSRRDTETAEDINLDEMTMEDVGEDLELFYQCRCGDYFAINSSELGEMGYSLNRDGNKVLIQKPDAIPASVLLPCGSCSLKIRLLIHVDCYGIVLRDDAERFRGAKSELVAIRSVEEGECCAVLEAVRWARDLNLRNVTFEGDCKRVVNFLRKEIDDIN